MILYSSEASLLTKSKRNLFGPRESIRHSLQSDSSLSWVIFIYSHTFECYCSVFKELCLSYFTAFQQRLLYLITDNLFCQQLFYFLLANKILCAALKSDLINISCEQVKKQAFIFILSINILIQLTSFFLYQHSKKEASFYACLSSIHSMILL